MILIFDVVLLVLIAYLLLFDRKVWAAVQMRRGPNVVGPFGLLQTFADLFKFLFKEVIIPAGANKVLFLIAPFLTVLLAFAGWAVVPLDDGWVVADINVGILYLLAMSSLGVYGIIIAGWASNSKYPFLSALRALERTSTGILRQPYRARRCPVLFRQRLSGRRGLFQTGRSGTASRGGFGHLSRPERGHPRVGA